MNHGNIKRKDEVWRLNRIPSSKAGGSRQNALLKNEGDIPMFMKPFEKHAYALLRIVAGFMFLCHGSQLILNFPASGYPAPPFVKYGAGLIELICGFLIMIGLGTRWAAFIASGLMAVAYWMAHGTKAFLPLLNQGEMAVLYCFVFLLISTHGSGAWSFDNILVGRRSNSD
jgi:putative oxidoreductase